MSLKQRLKSPEFKKVRKVVVTIVGGVVILAGVIMLFFPGPAFVVIPAGFAILATEFEWARRWVNKLRDPAYLKQVFYENSLTIVLLGLFVFCLAGQILSGQYSYNDERADYGQPPLKLKAYVFTGHCVEAVFENWESEFLQMGALVLLTIFLRQRGAMDSKKLSSHNRFKISPSRDPQAPWLARQRGWILKLYANSLSIALFLLFLISFLLHAAGGESLFNEELARQGKPAISFFGYMASSRFWFESFQNWQSEFLSIAVLIVLSIYLRQQGSPQSKPVAAPHSETA